MGDPFPLHQLLHCVGVDYWSDRVAFVSPRVFLFHCLFPPETLGKKNKIQKIRTKHTTQQTDEFSLYPAAAPAGQKDSSTMSLFLSHSWCNTTCCSGKGHQHFLNSLCRSGSWNKALNHSPEAALLFSFFTLEDCQKTLNLQSLCGLEMKRCFFPPVCVCHYNQRHVLDELLLSDLQLQHDRAELHVQVVGSLQLPLIVFADIQCMSENRKSRYSTI